MAFPANPDGRIEKNGVDALLVHDGEPRRGIIRAWRAAVGVADLAAGQELGGVHVDAAECAELAAERLEGLAVDEENFVTLVVTGDANRAASIVGIEIPQPGIGGLENVAVGIDHDGRRIIHHGTAFLDDIALSLASAPADRRGDSRRSAPAPSCPPEALAPVTLGSAH